MAVYDDLIDYNLNNLSHGVPGHARIQKENVIRKLAADLLLARTNLLVPRARSDNIPPIQVDSFGEESLSDDGLHGGTDFTTLLSLTTINEQSRSLAKAASDILAHWQPGMDPETYDWRGISQVETRLSRRASKKKKKKQQQQQQRRESESMQSLAAGPTGKAWQGSQPEPRATSQPSGSQVVEAPFPMTQVERGAFGGRGGKKKKKMRAAGF